MHFSLHKSNIFLMGQRTFIIVGQTTLYFPVFINQLKSRNLAARTIDEGAIDENGGGNFSEYVAILSGNDDLLEKAKQDKKLAVLESERQAYHRNKGNAKGKLNENTAGMPLKISGFVIVGSNSLQLIAIYHLPMQHIYIIDYQRPFILIGTTSVLTNTQNVGTNANRCISWYCIYVLYRLFSVLLWNVRYQIQCVE